MFTTIKSNPRVSIDRKQFIIIFAILTFGFLCFMRLVENAGYSFEGAYVTFRYATNLVEGKDFSFNPHEHILSTTTPLTAFLLTPFAWFSDRDMFPLAAQLLLAVIMIAATYINDLILKELGVNFTARSITMILTLVHPEFFKSAASGMETPVVCLLMSFGLLTLLSGGVISCAIIINCLLLVRIDTFPFVAALSFELLRTKRTHAVRALSYSSIILVSYIVYSFYIFGSPIPQSVLAKSGWFSAQFISNEHSIISYLIWIWSGVVGTISVVEPISYLGLSFILLIIFGIYSLSSSKELLAKIFLRCWAGFLFSFLFFYFLGRGATMFGWYLVPVLWISFIVAGIGINLILQICAELLSQKNYLRSYIISIAFIPSIMELISIDQGIIFDFAKIIREESVVRRRIGRFLKVYSPNATVLAESFGIIGYQSGCKMLEPTGILTKEALTLHAAGYTDNQIFMEFITSNEPEIVVLRESSLVVSETGIFSNKYTKEYFRKKYIEIQHFLPDDADPKKSRDPYLVFEHRNKWGVKHIGRERIGQS